MSDAADLVDQLCTRAAMILEDAIDVALTSNGPAAPEQRITAIRTAAGDALALAAAAQVIATRCR